MARALDLPPEACAFLDAIAVGESGGASDDAAYSVLFGGSHFSLGPTHEENGVAVLDGPAQWPPAFPQWAGVWVDDAPTHAAGRYQFEPATWRGLGNGSFDPLSQDHKAWILGQQAYRSATGRDLLTDLKANILTLAGSALQSTWTSVSARTFPSRYATALQGTQNVREPNAPQSDAPGGGAEGSPG